ncbi:hypothetical protein D3C84_1069190 [compost metagenome]
MNPPQRETGLPEGEATSLYRSHCQREGGTSRTQSLPDFKLAQKTSRLAASGYRPAIPMTAMSLLAEAAGAAGSFEVSYFKADELPLDKKSGSVSNPLFASFPAKRPEYSSAK